MFSLNEMLPKRYPFVNPIPYILKGIHAYYDKTVLFTGKYDPYEAIKEGTKRKEKDRRRGFLTEPWFFIAPAFQTATWPLAEKEENSPLWHSDATSLEDFFRLWLQKNDFNLSSVATSSENPRIRDINFVDLKTKTNYDRPLLLITGQAGTGKSSLVKKIVQAIYGSGEANDPFVYYLRFRNLFGLFRDTEGDFITELKHYLSKDWLEIIGIPAASFQVFGTSKTYCIILDGLDEWQMSANSNYNINLFLERVAQSLDYWNSESQNVKFRCIITTRDYFLDYKIGFEKIPYLRQNALLFHINLFCDNRQTLWLKAYAETMNWTEDKYEVISKKLSLPLKYIRELLEVPVSLNVVVLFLSKAYDRGDTNPQFPEHKAMFYDQLITDLLDRPWDDRGQSYPFAPRLYEYTTTEQIVWLRKLLQVVAYYMKVRSIFFISYNQLRILEKETLSKFPLPERLESLSKRGLSALLLAYYFKDKAGEKGALEFIHNEFLDHLAGENIVERFCKNGRELISTDLLLKELLWVKSVRILNENKSYDSIWRNVKDSLIYYSKIHCRTKLTWKFVYKPG